MTSLFETLWNDTVDESESLFKLLEGLSPMGWGANTACVPWTIGDHISHLAWNDDATVRALTDPGTFVASRPTTPEDIQAMVDAVITDHHTLGGHALLAWFRAARTSMVEAFRDADPKARMPWFGPDMSTTSKLTARFMETWAHGWDIVDALERPDGLEAPGAPGAPDTRYQPNDRLRHVVFLGLQALPNAFVTHYRPVPSEAVRVDVELPSGARLKLGLPDAKQVVEGDGYELALVVTQRRHVEDTSLRATGSVAHEWLQIAQAFAGPPGSKRTRSSD